MARFLESLNPAWKDGHGVALLTESNTAFGRNAGHAAKDVQDEKDEQSGTKLLTAAHENTPPGPFANAKSFNFPMHIAQLRSDAPALAQPGALLSGPVIPLNMRETVPPSDSDPRAPAAAHVAGSGIDGRLHPGRDPAREAVSGRDPGNRRSRRAVPVQGGEARLPGRSAVPLRNSRSLPPPRLRALPPRRTGRVVVRADAREPAGSREKLGPAAPAAVSQHGGGRDLLRDQGPSVAHAGCPRQPATHA